MNGRAPFFILRFRKRHRIDVYSSSIYIYRAFQQRHMLTANIWMRWMVFQHGTKHSFVLWWNRRIQSYFSNLIIIITQPPYNPKPYEIPEEHSVQILFIYFSYDPMKVRLCVVGLKWSRLCVAEILYWLISRRRLIRWASVALHLIQIVSGVALVVTQNR